MAVFYTEESRTFNEYLLIPGYTSERCVPDKVDLRTYADFEEFLEKNPGAKIYMATTKARRCYTDVHYEPDCFLMFGKESAGIPEEILVKYEETCVRIPMWGDIRSLNLANSAAILLYEALRQNGFPELEKEGNLHRLSW